MKGKKNPRQKTMSSPELEPPQPSSSTHHGDPVTHPPIPLFLPPSAPTTRPLQPATTNPSPSTTTSSSTTPTAKRKIQSIKLAKESSRYHQNLYAAWRLARKPLGCAETTHTWDLGRDFASTDLHGGRATNRIYILV